MNRKRVQMLRDMIAGIPAKRLYLDETYRGSSSSSTYPPPACGAIACIAGWAWIYPPFIKAGIRTMNRTAVDAAARFFDVPISTFGTRSDDEGLGTHKQIALRRLDALLK